MAETPIHNDFCYIEIKRAKYFNDTILTSIEKTSKVNGTTPQTVLRDMFYKAFDYEPTNHIQERDNTNDAVYRVRVDSEFMEGYFMQRVLAICDVFGLDAQDAADMNMAYTVALEEVINTRKWDA